MFVACIKRLATEVVLDNFKSLGGKKKLSHAGGVTQLSRLQLRKRLQESSS